MPDSTIPRAAAHQYEDFARQPEDALRAIARLTGVADIEGHLAALRAGTLPQPVVHSVAGNPIRLASGPVEVRLDEAWRRDLPRAERAKLATLTWPLRTAYRVRPQPDLALGGADADTPTENR